MRAEERVSLSVFELALKVASPFLEALAEALMGDGPGPLESGGGVLLKQRLHQRLHHHIAAPAGGELSDPGRDGSAIILHPCFREFAVQGVAPVEVAGRGHPGNEGLAERTLIAGGTTGCESVTIRPRLYRLRLYPDLL